MAITRTKNSATLISCGSAGTKDPSPFVQELKAGNTAGNIVIFSMKDSPDEWNPTLCPSCGSGRLVIRKNPETEEQFLGCTNYPYCTETYNQVEILQDKVRCPACGDWMVRRTRGEDGAPFFGCSNFPKCRTSFDADDDYNLIVSDRDRSAQCCPQCGSPLVVRTNREDGSQFYGCSSYPRCKYTRNF